MISNCCKLLLISSLLLLLLFLLLLLYLLVTKRNEERWDVRHIFFCIKWFNDYKIQGTLSWVSGMYTLRFNLLSWPSKLAEGKNIRPCWKCWILSKLCVPRKQHSTPFVFQEMADPSALKEYEVRLILFFLMTSIKTLMTPCPYKTLAPSLFLIAITWIISFL